MLTHQPCPCGKSSDAFTIYEDGHGYCFSGNCDKRYFKSVNTSEQPHNEGTTAPLVEQGEVSYQIIPLRGLTEDVLRKYDIKTKVVNDKPMSVGFQYDNLVKVRLLADKTFFTVGTKGPGLFGKKAFPKGSFKTLVITEGEFDAPSVFQSSNFPAVSVASSSSAFKDCQADFDYINSAERIVLAFDNDEPGQKAAKAVASLFDFNKVFRVSFDLKDANDYVQAGRGNELRSLITNAKKFVPDGVISSYEEVAKALEEEDSKPICSLPFKELEEKLEGLRTSTSYLFSGLEGIGKTEVFRALQYQVLKETPDTIGIIHLEEGTKSTIRNLVSYEMEIPLKRANAEVPNQEILAQFRTLTKRDNRVFVYSHYGSNNPDDFLQIVRYLVGVCGCKHIFFDHINILVSGLSVDGDERRTLDYLCTKLAMLVEELDFTLYFICHENDDGRPRGSRNMSQVAKVHISLSRDIRSENPMERNRLHFMVAKNRPAGFTGPAGFAVFDENKGKLVDSHIYEKDNYLPDIENHAA